MQLIVDLKCEWFKKYLTKSLLKKPDQIPNSRTIFHSYEEILYTLVMFNFFQMFISAVKGALRNESLYIL